jgi:predicted RND superfamily exporter protein
MIEPVAKRYARIVTQRPGTILLIVLGVTAVMTAGAQRVDVVEQNEEDILPDSIPSVAAFNTIQAEFSSAEPTTYTILLETAPRYANSTEVRDVRNPRFLRYVETISNDIERLDRVSSVSSPTDLFDQLPASKRQTRTALDQIGEERWGQSIADDYAAARIQVEASGLSADEDVELAADIQATVEAHPRVPGVDITYTGQTYIDQAFQEQSDRTMGITTSVSLLGVLIVVILLFRSLYYGITALLALVIGIMAGYGAFGWMGLNMSPSTSGALSIGVGIAVDFGIQPVARYREERAEQDMQAALATTIEGIARPMTLGMIAAIMGFASLSIGKITFLSDLGILLTLTTFIAFVAAFTVIPPVVILYDRYLEEYVSMLFNRIQGELT